MNFKNVQAKIKKTIDEVGEDIKIYKTELSDYNEVSGQEKIKTVLGTIKGSIQKTSQDDIENLPEGDRAKVIKKLLHYEEITDTNAILERENGDTYEIYVLPDDHYVAQMNMYYRTYLAKKEVNSNE